MHPLRPCVRCRSCPAWRPRRPLVSGPCLEQGHAGTDARWRARERCLQGQDACSLADALLRRQYHKWQSNALPTVRRPGRRRRRAAATLMHVQWQLAGPAHTTARTRSAAQARRAAVRCSVAPPSAAWRLARAARGQRSALGAHVPRSRRALAPHHVPLARARCSVRSSMLAGGARSSMLETASYSAKEGSFGRVCRPARPAGTSKRASV
jgi:hypothetical protein